MLLGSTISAELRAFPGAEGMAALTRGAAGYSGAKTVVRVTNLLNTGAGSLRAAIEGTGNEGVFVVFTVSGVIDLETEILCQSSFMTIAGQTSPGGICVAGSPIAFGNSSTHDYTDVIIRHMRFILGDHHGHPRQNLDCMRLITCGDFMIDHCSFSWTQDEIFQTGTTTGTDGGCYNITLSHCIISLPIKIAPDNHNFGPLFYSTKGTDPENSGEMHHCFLCLNARRNPEIQSRGRYNLINNIVYGFDNQYGHEIRPFSSTHGELFVNEIGCFVTTASARTDSAIGSGSGNETVAEMSINGNDGSYGGADMGTNGSTPYEAIYMSNNFGATRLLDSDPEFAVSRYNTGLLLSTDWQRTTKFPTNGIDVTPTVLVAATAKAQMETLLADMGATKPARDSHDDTAVAHFVNTTGVYPTVVPTFPDDWPTYSTASDNPTDTDSDGIPDSYETAQGFTSTSMVPTDAAPSGYLWIEEYINSLA